MNNKIRLHWNSRHVYLQIISVYIYDPQNTKGFTWYDIKFYNPDLFHNKSPYLWYSSIKRATFVKYLFDYVKYKDWSEV